MLSPAGARSQQAVQKSYVCLSCQLRAQQRRQNSTGLFPLEGTRPRRRTQAAPPAIEDAPPATVVQETRSSAPPKNRTDRRGVFTGWVGGKPAFVPRAGPTQTVDRADAENQHPLAGAYFTLNKHHIGRPFDPRKDIRYYASGGNASFVRRWTANEVAIRKQWGTPVSAKSWAELDAAQKDKFENILDRHLGDELRESAELKESTAVRGESKTQSDADTGQRWDAFFNQAEGHHTRPTPDTAAQAAAQPVLMYKPSSPTSGHTDPQGHEQELRDDAGWMGDLLGPSESGSQSDQPRRPRALQSMQWTTSRKEARAYHTSAQKHQGASAAVFSPAEPPLMPHQTHEHPNGIRAQLRRWQGEFGAAAEKKFNDQTALNQIDEDGELNSLSKLNDPIDVRKANEQTQEEAQAMAHFSNVSDEDMDTDQATDPRFLHMGDLVEIEFPNSEKESLLAIYIRRNGPDSQFFTQHGRWLHFAERNVQYAVPGYVPKELLDPIIPYLPTEEQMEDTEALMQEAYVNDLSVPRQLAAPLVSRMAEFNRESLEIYRKHASALDNAHNIMAHDTDLRYGSLTSAASTLLRKPAHELSVASLFTVHKALMHAGFAFNVDRRSHRLTGYLQIRSKEQVKMVETVRTWLREWQDDLAVTAGMSEKQLKRHDHSRGARYVMGFLNKAKRIILRSRENRDVTPFGSVGPSKVKREITPEQEAVKVTTKTQFDEHDEELVRFIEAWSCNNMFLGLPRIAALPPLILQASGMYPEGDLNKAVGYVFLQEIGTIMPYENRVRFDQHLLLPSSQHSKPLQALMMNLMVMAKNPEFTDSMADLRHDWGQMPVYCIDAASAHEIDDGISIERATPEDEAPEWWVHVHIANPTAFFDRNHALAKMARHMGESIYMPERAYMMLPRWATQKHFSLANGRPCLTFSARMNEKGEVLEKKARSGIVNNVYRITPEQTKTIIGLGDAAQEPPVTISVGGEPPPSKDQANSFSRIEPANVEELKTLQRLAEGRTEVRKAAGGVFFDHSPSEVNVWQSAMRSGLAWDHPHRKGSRIVEGDPVIQLQARQLTNFFTAAKGNTDILVREMMLLACEISTSWCADRQIPTLYRGSVPKPDQVDAATFYREVCEPAIAKNNGEIPLHIGIQYVQHQGSLILSTRPLKHNLLGLSHYGKVTSPLRRYGDMILHWQIEAALREEARIGRSLVTEDPSVNRDFLPFSRPALENIAIGLKPREGIVTRAKFYAQHFWTIMLLFRAHHFGEAQLPWETLHTYVGQKPMGGSRDILCVNEEMNISVSMLRPEKYGLPAAKLGDRWECVLEQVQVYDRSVFLRPLRLIERWED